MSLDQQIERAKIRCYIHIDVYCCKVSHELNKKYNLIKYNKLSSAIDSFLNNFDKMIY